jgi:hypothetical protein
MLCYSYRAGGNGGGGRCNTLPPKPLEVEGDFLFPPLFVGWLPLQGDAMLGVSFSSTKRRDPTKTSGSPVIEWGSGQSDCHVLELPGHIVMLPSASACLSSQQIAAVVHILPPCWQWQCRRHSTEQSHSSMPGTNSNTRCCFQPCLCGSTAGTATTQQQGWLITALAYRISRGISNT